MTVAPPNPFAAPRDDAGAPAIDVDVDESGMPAEVRRLARAYRLLMRAWAWQASIVAGWFTLGVVVFVAFFSLGLGSRWGWRWPVLSWVMGGLMLVGGLAYLALIGVIAVAAWRTDRFVGPGVTAVLFAVGCAWAILQDTHDLNRPGGVAFKMLFWFPVYGWPGVAVVARRAAARLRRAGAAPGWFVVDWLGEPDRDEVGGWKSAPVAGRVPTQAEAER